jgi:hypothetical protein
MNTNRDRRIARLEQDRRPKGKIIYAWRDAPLESAKQAIARRCPKGVPSGARLVICSWRADGKPLQPARR